MIMPKRQLLTRIFACVCVSKSLLIKIRFYGYGNIEQFEAYFSEECVMTKRRQERLCVAGMRG